MPKYFVEHYGGRGQYFDALKARDAARDAPREVPDAEVKRIWRIFADGSQRILKERSWK